MRIGFDAKRLFFNHSGLGNYSRSTVELLHKYRHEDQYLLFSPKKGNPCGFIVEEDMSLIFPNGIGSALPSLWRSYGMAGAIKKQHIDIFHGLSNELPADIKRAKVRSIVSMHDLIFERYPEFYRPLDRMVYVNKYKRSCRNADHIIAISNQTKGDLIDFWKIPEDKISVVYQGCNPVYSTKATEEIKQEVCTRLSLPHRYLLSVGTIEARKNLMLTLKAMAMGSIDVDLVACGRYTPYVDTLVEYASRHNIAHRLHIYHNVEFKDLPALYQMSEAVVYTSIFEGFGIPILEGMNSGVPVITTRGGVFGETGGDAAIYVDTDNVDQMIEAISSLLNNTETRETIIARGYIHAAKFKEEHIATNLGKVYEKVML